MSRVLCLLCVSVFLLSVASSKPPDPPTTQVDHLRWRTNDPLSTDLASNDDDDDDDDVEETRYDGLVSDQPRGNTKSRKRKNRKRNTQSDKPVDDGRPPKSNKRLNACKNGNKFLKTKLKTQRQQYKSKMQTIKKLLSEMFDDSFSDPELPLKNFCKEEEIEESAGNEAVLNDHSTGSAAGQAARPCELTPWSEWNHLAFGTLERRRNIVREGCGCPSPDEMVQVVDILQYLGNNTSPSFADPKKVGKNFESDFLNPFKNGNGSIGASTTNGGVGVPYRNGLNRNVSGAINGWLEGGGNGGNGYGPGVGSASSIRDILMILDSSGSIESDDFDLMKEGLVAMVDLFCGGFGPGDKNNRLALVQFASNVTIIHRFRDSQTPADLKAKVMGLRHYKGNTCTGNALSKSMNEVFTLAEGMREHTVKDTLIVTDGQSNCGVDIREAAEDLQVSSNVFALGVGIAGKVRARDEVKSVVSNQDPHHIFSLAKFSDFKEMVDNLKRLKRTNDPCLPIVSP